MHTLLLQVPGLFAASFTKFKAMPPLERQPQLYWMDWYLRCVPLPEHMHVRHSGTGAQGGGAYTRRPCVKGCFQWCSLCPPDASWQ